MAWCAVTLTVRTEWGGWCRCLNLISHPVSVTLLELMGSGGDSWVGVQLFCKSKHQELRRVKSCCWFFYTLLDLKREFYLLWRFSSKPQQRGAELPKSAPEWVKIKSVCHTVALLIRSLGTVVYEVSILHTATCSWYSLEHQMFIDPQLKIVPIINALFTPR